MTSSEVVLAYVPVLHEGYRRFLERHGRDRRVFLIGPELHAEHRALAKDVRALPAADAAAAIAGWEIAASVAVLDGLTAERLAAEDGLSLIAPAEDVSYAVVERHFPRAAVRYDPVFLRWDKTRTVQMLDPRPARVVTEDQALADLAAAAEEVATHSIDWWRQVGAALRFADGGPLAAAANAHHPHEQAPYAVGDPRANFFQGVELELSTATHAEAALIADAARAGRATEGGVMYVTDFPCPPCAKLIASAGITRLYYRRGYAVLDGRDVLEAAGVEVVEVKAAHEAPTTGA